MGVASGHAAVSAVTPMINRDVGRHIAGSLGGADRGDERV